MTGIRWRTTSAALVAALVLAGCAGAPPDAASGSWGAVASSGGASPAASSPAPAPAGSSASSPSRTPEAAGSAEPSAQPTPTSAGATVRVLDWIDGDTVDTTAGRVRVIGYDTPERGECGFEAATAVATRLARPGSLVALVVEPGNDDTDRYDRLLRRVVAGGRDVGLALIRSGYAVARYDSRDGYPGHSLEQAYRTADAATPDRTCP